MSDTAYDAYLEAVRRLPIRHPTDDDAAALLPHLGRGEAAATLRRDRVAVAPPLRVRGSSHALCLDDDDTVRHGLTRRIARSYAPGNPAIHGDVFWVADETSEVARSFAEEHWGDRLVLDDWVDVVTFVVQVPRVEDERPRTVASPTAALSRSVSSLDNDASAPRSMLYDAATVELHGEGLISHELRGGRGGYHRFNCARCASSLGLSACRGCKVKFLDDGLRYGSLGSLPPKVVALLQRDGHRFEVDPSVVWAEEARQHAAGTR